MLKLIYLQDEPLQWKVVDIKDLKPCAVYEGKSRCFGREDNSCSCYHEEQEAIQLAIKNAIPVEKGSQEKISILIEENDPWSIEGEIWQPTPSKLYDIPEGVELELKSCNHHCTKDCVSFAKCKNKQYTIKSKVEEKEKNLNDFTCNNALMSAHKCAIQCSDCKIEENPLHQCVGGHNYQCRCKGECEDQQPIKVEEKPKEETMKSKHTPLPWIVRTLKNEYHEGCFVECEKEIIKKPYGQEILGDDYHEGLSKEEDAKFIVEACNNYYQFQKQLDIKHSVNIDLKIKLEAALIRIKELESVEGEKESQETQGELLIEAVHSLTLEGYEIMKSKFTISRLK